MEKRFRCQTPFCSFKCAYIVYWLISFPSNDNAARVLCTTFTHAPRTACNLRQKNFFFQIIPLSDRNLIQYAAKRINVYSAIALRNSYHSNSKALYICDVNLKWSPGTGKKSLRWYVQLVRAHHQFEGILCRIFSVAQRNQKLTAVNRFIVFQLHMHLHWHCHKIVMTARPCAILIYSTIFFLSKFVKFTLTDIVSVKLDQSVHSFLTILALLFGIVNAQNKLSFACPIKSFKLTIWVV